MQNIEAQRAALPLRRVYQADVVEPRRAAVVSRRLALRVLGPEDASARVRYSIANREHHAASAPLRTDAFFETAYWEQRLQGSFRRFEDGQSLEFYLFETDAPGRIIGDCSFDGFVHGVFQACYLGYNLDKDAVGRGLMHEALKAVLDYVYDATAIHRVMANYMPSNDLFLNGAWRDHVLTALHADEWARSRGAR